MAKVLNELPDGLALNVPPKAPSGPPKAGSVAPSRQSQGLVPRALERPKPRGDRWINSQEGHEWLMRRCEAFGFASSRYFKKSGTCPRPTKGQ